MITDDEIAEDNINPVNEIITDKNLLEFVFLSIEKLEVRPPAFVEFELFLKTTFLQNSYLLNYNPIESTQNYIRSIEYLFEQDDTMTLIQNKIQTKFPLDTQDVMIQDAMVVFLPENNYSLPFVISGGTCILNNKMNTSLKSDLQTSVNELENMKVDWKISTLIFWGKIKKLLMNGFISWHMWIKDF